MVMWRRKAVTDVAEDSLRGLWSARVSEQIAGEVEFQVTRGRVDYNAARGIDKTLCWNAESAGRGHSDRMESVEETQRAMERNSSGGTEKAARDAERTATDTKGSKAFDGSCSGRVYRKE